MGRTATTYAASNCAINGAAMCKAGGATIASPKNGGPSLTRRMDPTAHPQMLLDPMAQEQRPAAALRRLGIPPQRAEVGRSSRGAWRMARHAVVQEALSNRPLKRYRFSCHQTSRVKPAGSNRRMRKTARPVVWEPCRAQSRQGDPIQRSGLISSEWPAGPRSDRPGAGERAVSDHDGVIVEGDGRADVARDGMKHVADLKPRCVRSFGDEMLFAVGGKDGVRPLDQPRARLGVLRGHSLVAEIEREAIVRRLADHAGKDSGCGNKRQVRETCRRSRSPRARLSQASIRDRRARRGSGMSASRLRQSPAPAARARGVPAANSSAGAIASSQRRRRVSGSESIR